MIVLISILIFILLFFHVSSIISVVSYVIYKFDFDSSNGRCRTNDDCSSVVSGKEHICDTTTNTCRLGTEAERRSRTLELIERNLANVEAGVQTMTYDMCSGNTYRMVGSNQMMYKGGGRADHSCTSGQLKSTSDNIQATTPTDAICCE